ncbi:choice-of-anchor Q domain-containing protein [Rheinheimera sp. MM224]|uniref:choice-of-anchor Q domain-containing protein n=1 Tax=Rheinheimera sp. MM224 TaxID=3019969 RepID=UPI0021F8EEF7|nr:choice-of-anchor Q domain-containing protein [Rheinheimera sp. MM224]CAI3806461.1 hypothetical protein JAMGFMIE_04189 [Rheinheimera sp. MM224]
MKLFYAVLGALLLSGCGGGGGGDSVEGGSGGGNGGGSGGGNSADPLAQYINISSSYNGNKNKADVNLTTLATFNDYLFFVAPELLPDYDDSDNSGFLNDSCPEGGSVNIEKTSKENELKFTFASCQSEGTIVTGPVTARILSTNSMGEVTEAQFIFQDVQLAADFGTYTLRGVMRQTSTGDVCTDTTTTYNLLLNGPASHQIFFNNFKFNRVGNAQVYCSANGIYLAGEVMDSRYGGMSFLSSEVFILNTMIIGPEKGRLQLTGANNASAIWSVNSYQNGSSTDTFYRFDIDADGDQEFEVNYRYLNEYFSAELLTSFEDNDGDGIQDTWELKVGLSPTDPADALQDRDADGFTNIDEFRYLGNPNDSLVKPAIADLQLGVSDREFGFGDDFHVPIELSNLSSNVDATDVVLTLNLRGDAEFRQTMGCLLTQQNKQLVCRFDKLNARSITNVSYGLLDPAKGTGGLSVSITANITSFAHDPNPNDNQQSFQISRSKAQPDYGIYAHITQNEPITHFLGLVSDVANYEFTLINKGDNLEGSSVVMTVPPQVSIESMTCYDKGSQSWVNCDLRTMWNLQVDSLHFRMTLKGELLGNDELTLSVSHPSMGALKSFKMPIVVGQSASTIQLAVDASADGAIVEVPAGIYIGSIDLTAKKTVLKSAFGADTTFLFASKFKLGLPASTIKLAYGSSVSGFTISHFILTEQDGSIVENNVFGKTEWHRPGASIYSEHDLVIRKNTATGNFIVPDFNYSTSSIKGCSSIQILNKDVNPVEVVVENNLFLGPLKREPGSGEICGGAVFSASGSIKLAFNHNTISGVGYGVSVEQYSFDSVAEVQINNNIFSASLYAVRLNWSSDYSSEISAQLKNNLYWDNYANYEGVAGVPLESGKISANPGLNQNGLPVAGSPVIDAAVDVGLTTDVNGAIRPVDGNGDGIAAPDIGAVEFQP